MTNRDSATYDLLGMIEDHPVTFTWDGDEYEGTIGTLTKTEQLQEGGFLGDFDLVLVTSILKRTAAGVNELVPRFDENELPAIGDTVVIEDPVTEVDTSYRVELVRRDEYGAGIHLGLRTTNK